MAQTVTKVYSIPNFNPTAFDNLAVRLPRITQEVEVRDSALPETWKVGRGVGEERGLHSLLYQELVLQLQP